MTGRQEIEDALEEHAWRERNQLEPMSQIGAAAVPPMEALKVQAARDYPMEYEPQERTGELRIFLEFVAFVIVVTVGAALATWVWNNTWGLHH